MHLCVLGAGIIGFNTALQLQESFPNAKITLIAENFENETTSFRAAGIFRPSTNFCGPSKLVTREWIRDSYDFYDDLLKSSVAADAGISEISGYIFSSEHPFITRNSFLEDLVPIYRNVTEDELKVCPGNWKFGSFFTTLLIESNTFLPWAKEQFVTSGGKILKKKIEKWGDLEHSNLNCGSFDAVFNCTGFGSKWLCNDTKLVPVRGQVLKVKAPWIKMFFYGDYDTYVVPGQQSVTLGGCRQLDSYDTSISELDSKGIWERCTSLVPSLKKASIENVLVGLRPHRDEVRCELERPSDENFTVIHNYGHGGYGVTTAPGTARYAVNLYRDSLRCSNGGHPNIPQKLTCSIFSKL